jgi:DNA-directed RNA polymerase subunit L
MWTAIMVIAIVAITQYARVMRAKYNAQHGIVEDRKGRVQMLAQPTDTELQREVETLRERIKVLERIATDEHKPQALAAEIESLRDR